MKDDILFSGPDASERLKEMKSQSLLKKAYKEAEQYFKDNEDEFDIQVERKRFLLDDDNKIVESILPSSP